MTVGCKNLGAFAFFLCSNSRVALRPLHVAGRRWVRNTSSPCASQQKLQHITTYVILMYWVLIEYFFAEILILRYCFKKRVPLFAGKFLQNSSRTDRRLRNHEKAMMRPNIESSDCWTWLPHERNIECRGALTGLRWTVPGDTEALMSTNNNIATFGEFPQRCRFANDTDAKKIVWMRARTQIGTHMN